MTILNCSTVNVKKRFSLCRFCSCFYDVVNGFVESTLDRKQPLVPKQSQDLGLTASRPILKAKAENVHSSIYRDPVDQQYFFPSESLAPICKGDGNVLTVQKTKK